MDYCYGDSLLLLDVDGVIFLHDDCVEVSQKYFGLWVMAFENVGTFHK